MCLAMATTCALAQPVVGAEPLPPQSKQLAPGEIRLSKPDAAKVFRAAGFHYDGHAWRGCELPIDADYHGPMIESVRDYNGDGLPDAIVTDSSISCYGISTGIFSIVSKQRDGSWNKIADGTGVPEFLPRKVASGWPDLSIGGPGFCFSVQKWTGSSFEHDRFEYMGEPCGS